MYNKRISFYLYSLIPLYELPAKKSSYFPTLIHLNAFKTRE